MKRKFYNELLEWKNSRNGATAAMIDGARRIGKSFIAKEFAQNEYKSFILIDFSLLDSELEEIFTKDIGNFDLFFSKLSVKYGVQLYKRNSVFIFDEVQLFPMARQLIKHLVADGRYDYIETGSLITLKKNVETILIPSEEEHFKMYPMDFEEFLWAMGDEVTFPFIQKCFETKTPLGQSIHRKVMNQFREYLLVGGMPQAVLAYREQKDFEATDKTKRGILDLYRNDISKFAKGYESKVSAIFDEIPSQLTKHEKKYTFASLSKSARFRDYEDAFMWLSDAGIANYCFNSTDPNVGLALSAERNTLKCYLNDTGLLVTHTLRETKISSNELYKAILFDKLDFNEGAFIENIVAQALACTGHKLFFYSSYDKKNKDERIEIDFLISQKNKIIPIEVKSGKRFTHASLDKFCVKYKKLVKEKIIFSQKDLSVQNGILCLPLYMAWCV